MTGDFFVRLYERLSRHRILCMAAATVIGALCAAYVATLEFDEDISEFIPEEQRQTLEIIREANGAGRIFAVITGSDDPDFLASAADNLAGKITEANTEGLLADVTALADLSQWRLKAQERLALTPLLAPDTLLETLRGLTPEQVGENLEEDCALLMLPFVESATRNIGADPLGIFSPVSASLPTEEYYFDIYDGHILTSDHTAAIVMARSTRPPSETADNARAVTLIEKAGQQLGSGVTVTCIGDAPIAVANARRIKADSLICLAVAMALIIGIMWWHFRTLRSAGLILLTLGLAWIVALAILGAVSGGRVSMLVLGMASVIIGIAVNYPLHYLAHLNRNPGGPPATLRQLVTPLVIGNVTTVAAFAALIPMESAALRALGIFAAVMLLATIAIVMILLPQMAGNGSNTGKKEPVRESSPESRHKEWRGSVVLLVVLGLSAALLPISSRARFDTDLSQLNYMDPGQRHLYERLHGMVESTASAGYVVAEGRDVEEALRLAERDYPAASSCLPPSLARQKENLQLWKEAVASNRDVLVDTLLSRASVIGFAPDAFDSYLDILKADIQPSYYLADDAALIHKKDGTVAVVAKTDVPFPDLPSSGPVRFIKPASAFEGLGDSLANDFNYIGWICGSVVFVFLWVSFRRFSVAVIAFLPMAVGWIWILAAMTLMDIPFNVVNIILATFIFGQGDDYTIFVTEGLLYERRTGKKILKHFRIGILLSAAVLTVGIGALAFATHPALKSLGQVTLVGMATVVAMSWIIPPAAFRTMDLLCRRFPRLGFLHR